LLAIAQISHVAPEGALNGVVRLLTFGIELFVFSAVFAAWVAPVFATFVLGPERRRVSRRHFFRPALAPRVPQ
jgi:hypothetical protein